MGPKTEQGLGFMSDDGRHLSDKGILKVAPGHKMQLTVEILDQEGRLYADESKAIMNVVLVPG